MTPPKLHEARTPRPTFITEHAVDRFVERWAPPSQQGPSMRVAHATTLREIVRYAIPGAWLPKERQQIWTWTGALPWLDHGHVEIQLVVNVDGTVKTVLPDGARRPPSRRS